MKIISINGVNYSPREHLVEALSIIAAFSELYDDLAANPSPPTPEEKRREAELSRRWTVLVRKTIPRRTT